MSDGKWFTVSELSKQISIPQPTIRRYIERHGHHLHVKKHHKSYLISEKSFPVIIRIRERYAEGMGTSQVEDHLASSGAPTIITVSDTSDSDNQVSVNALESLVLLEKSMSELMIRSEQQEKFNQLLLEKLNEQQAYIERSIKQRDEQLMIGLRELAAAKEKQQKRGWFSRLFGEKT